MFTWKPFPFLRICITLIAGILVYGQNLNIELLHVAIGSLVCFLLCVLIVFAFKNRFWSGVFGLITFFLLGYLVAFLHDETNKQEHYINYDYQNSVAFSGIITSDVLIKEKYYRYDIRLQELLTQNETVAVSGKIHLYIRRDSLLQPLRYGDRVRVAHTLSAVPPPNNPMEFDYRTYISRSGIYAQTFVDAEKVGLTTYEPENWLMARVIGQRQNVRDLINQLIASERERQIALALFIGIKTELDVQTRNAYAAAGAMHVLAVSGLHVGIIYMIIAFLLSPLKKVPMGNWLFVVLLISALWLYAMLTGLSPSVMRAATMFSVIALKDIRLKNANIYNSLGIAAFVLLLFDPNFIYAVGFQLSFIAVFGIVYFYPRIYPLWLVENWLLDKIWAITCISIAAQLATFPLTVYYFNQFPTYFLISNLFVIPGATVLMIVGLPMIVLGFVWNAGGLLLGKLAGYILYAMNELVYLVEQLPQSLITWLYFDQIQTVLCYAIILLFFLARDYRSFTALSTSLLGMWALVGSFHLNYWRSLQQQQLVVYEIKDKLAIDWISGREAKLYISEYMPDELELLKFQVDPFRRASGLPPIDKTICSLEDLKDTQVLGPLQVFGFKGKKIGILAADFSEWEATQPVKVDYLILSNNSKINERTFSQVIVPDHIIVAPDCDYWYVNHLIRLSENANLSVHAIGKDGYWSL